MGDDSAGKGEADWCYRSERGERDLSCMRWPRGNRQPLCARTGMAWRSMVCWLLILIRAGVLEPEARVLEPGAPSPGAATGSAFARIFGARWLRTGKLQQPSSFSCHSLQCRFIPSGGGLTCCHFRRHERFRRVLAGERGPWRWRGASLYWCCSCRLQR